jgi:hypothetical protein
MEHLFGQGEFDYSYIEAVQAWREEHYHTFSRTSPYNDTLRDANSAAECSAEWDASVECTAAPVHLTARDRVLAALTEMPGTFYELRAVGELSGAGLTALLKDLFREGLIHKCAGSHHYMLKSQLTQEEKPS